MGSAKNTGKKGKLSDQPAVEKQQCNMVPAIHGQRLQAGFK